MSWNDAVIPPRVSICGGGRWARVIAGIVNAVSPASTRISIHTPHNLAGMSAWAEKQPLSFRIAVLTAPPTYGPMGPHAIIVVNAAQDHFAAAASALSAHVPTLVEKPLSTTLEQACTLAALAKDSGTMLACSHVFLFAGYISTLAKIVKTHKAPDQVRLIWEDPAVEERYGESKSYDPSLPLPLDILPHIVPILRVAFPGAIEYEDIKLARGGARVDLKLLMGKVPCFLTMERNGNRRRRSIEVNFGGRSPVELDFSDEPGILTSGTAQAVSADPDWGSTPSPMTLMLRAFLLGATTRNLDSRLAPELALDSCRIAKASLHAYRTEQRNWLVNNADAPMNVDLRYALTELYCASVPNAYPSTADLEKLKRSLAAPRGLMSP